MKKVCIIGAGFTGMFLAVALKKNCPHLHVTMIESDKEPRNLGFGESGPPQLLRWIFDFLKVSPDEQTSWLQHWLINTNSTVKYNFKWQNFLGVSDNGYMSGVRDLPDYRAIFDGGLTKLGVDTKIALPDNTAYRINDLWYELYLAGRRQMSDFQPDINDFYWFAEKNRIWSVDNQLISSSMTSHLNSFEVCEYFRKYYGHLIDQIIPGTVQDIQVDELGNIKHLTLDTGEQITSQFYLDCTGFRRLIAKRMSLELSRPEGEILHNAAVITANKYQDVHKEMEPQTLGYGMDYGWTFSVPLLNRKSFGYTYDSSFINADQALQELDTLSNPNTRCIDPIKLQWEPGGYKEAFQNNYALVGLSSGFIDPFDANTIALQMRQIQNLIPLFNDKNPIIANSQCKQKYNRITWQFFESVAQRVEYHFGLAPRNTSEYWKRNKQIAIERSLEDRIFDTMNDYRHTSAAMNTNDFIPYAMGLYLSETLYYGIDMSRRCRRSSPEVLDFALEYFQTRNRLNRLRAELCPTMTEWYAQQGIDILKMNE